MESQLNTTPPEFTGGFTLSSAGATYLPGSVIGCTPTNSPPHDPLIQVMEILQRLPEDHRTRLIDAIAVYYGYILDDNE